MEQQEILTEFSKYLKEEKQILPPGAFPKAVSQAEVDPQEIEKWSKIK